MLESVQTLQVLGMLLIILKECGKAFYRDTISWTAIMVSVGILGTFAGAISVVWLCGWVLYSADLSFCCVFVLRLTGEI